jgi:hypothetical protein
MLRSVHPYLGLVILSGFAPASAAYAAEYSGVYEGTIGAARVVVELGDGDGTYFYDAKGVDILLQITAKNGALEIVEKSGDDDAKAAPTGRWTLALKADNLTGTWSAPKGGRSLPIMLTRTAPAAAPKHNEADRGVAPTPYQEKWIAAHVHWSLGPEVSVGDLSYAVATDSAYNTRMPRLVRFADAGRVAKINAAIEKLQLQKILEARDTALSLRQSKAASDSKPVNTIAEVNPDDETDLRVTKLAPDALSFVVRGILDGGGAQPNTYATAYTIDLVKAKPVEGTLLSNSEAAKPTQIFDGALDIGTPQKRRAFDALWIGKLRARLPQTSAKGDDDSDGSCIEDIKSAEFPGLGGSTYALYVVEGGLAVHPRGWPNVAAYCFSEFKYVPVVLTSQELKPFIAPGRSLIGMK